MAGSSVAGDRAQATAALAQELRRWLGQGPIQAPTGAIWAWVDADTGRPSFEYPEITGYLLTLLAGHDSLPEAERIRGRLAASWLTERLEGGNLAARDGWDDGAAYAFDLAMISSGLITFGRSCGEERHLRAGLDTAALLRDAIDPDGLPPVLGGAGTTSRGGWSAAGRAHNTKAAQCLLLAHLEGLDGALDAARGLVSACARYQQDDGRFITEPEDTKTMLHPHLYTVEGLWMWASAMDDDDARERARAGLAWAWEQQLEGGALPRSVGAAGEPIEQGDLTGQAIRLAAALGEQPPGLGEAELRLMDLAVPSGEWTALGYQIGAEGSRHQNAWVTMFGLQALEWSAFGPGDWWTLV